MDRAAAALVLALVLAAFLTWPVIASLRPSLVVIASWTRSSAPAAERTDPYGRPFVIRTSPSGAKRVHSVGADGVDQGGGGDDVILFDQVGGGAPSGRVLAGSVLLSQSKGFLLVLACFVAGTYVSARRGRRARTWRRELHRATALAVPIGVLAATMAFLASYTFLGEEAAALLQRGLVLPVRAALVGSTFVGTALLILLVRVAHRDERPVEETRRPETLEEAAARWLPEVLGAEDPSPAAGGEPPAEASGPGGA
jgi:hypothetical protein